MFSLPGYQPYDLMSIIIFTNCDRQSFLINTENNLMKLIKPTVITGLLFLLLIATFSANSASPLAKCFVAIDGDEEISPIKYKVALSSANNQTVEILENKKHSY